jgi:hypothetical protein
MTHRTTTDEIFRRAIRERLQEEKSKMTRQQALREIKQLRDRINDVPDPTDEDGGPWVNDVCHHLDAAANVIEFPASDAE